MRNGVRTWEKREIEDGIKLDREDRGRVKERGKERERGGGRITSTIKNVMQI